MTVDILSFNDGTKVGSCELNSTIFNVDVRVDIVHRVVQWQLGNRMMGTKKRKNLSEVSGTGRKPHAQKGTGNARLGTLRPPQARGGAAAHPVATIHKTKLQKKVRLMGIKSALSDKLAHTNIFVVDNLYMSEISTKALKNHVGQLSPNGLKNSYYIVTSDILSSEACNNIYQSACNLHNVNLTHVSGINVYDIVKHDNIILDVKSLACLEERLL